MKIVQCSFRFDRDLNQVRELLHEIFKQNGSLHYLIPTKVENQKFGPCGPDYTPEDDEVFRIWRTSNGADSEIFAVSHRGSSANYHIEIHPDYKHLEPDLFQEIEKLEKSITGKRESRILMYTVNSDTLRPKVLAERGYEDYGLHEYNYEFPLDATVQENPMPEGYAIRNLSNEQDYAQFVEVIGSVYDHCQQHMTLEKMRFLTEADFFHPDLNLVAVDETDRFMGFCMYRLDPLTGIAEIEALGARPDFNDLGLEEALLSEGLRRVLKHQPTLVCCVEVDISESLNQMLKSAGFIQIVTMNMWGKMI